MKDTANVSGDQGVYDKDTTEFCFSELKTGSLKKNISLGTEVVIQDPNTTFDIS